MHKNDIIYIEHILNGVEKIIRFTDKMDEKAFLVDEKTQSAVIRELEVIGEATKKLSVEFREKNPQAPWQLMAGMRDVLIHDYEGVDLLSVWNTVSKDIPPLKYELERLR